MSNSYLNPISKELRSLTILVDAKGEKMENKNKGLIKRVM